MFEASVGAVGVSEEFKDTPEIRELTKKHEHMKRQRKLFAKCVFLLSRETPIYSLQYLISSFGGQFYTAEEEVPEGTEITHIVMDRPLPASMKLKKCEYVQPQYIADCANNIHLLPTAAYKPGIPPPAHLSPFIDGKKEGYMPRREQEIRMLKGEEIIVDEESEDENAASDKEEDKPAPAATASKKQSAKTKAIEK